MEFREMVLKNRSYRGFDESVAISKEELMDLVDLARNTPSARNLQPLKYHLSYEKEEVESILAYTRWAGALPALHLPKDGQHPTAFILICNDGQLAADPKASSKDVGIVAQTMLLGAVEKGLGGIMIGAFDQEGVKEYLKIPANLQPQLLIALGKPVEEIHLVDMKDGRYNYYRDDAGVHYVPKRSMEEILF
ncbi:MAG: nitroreductase family protein [Lachnospiraceae bacterium]|nr:nitroreductase family protein [Lachnospiraceae bacterium]